MLKVFIHTSWICIIFMLNPIKGFSETIPFEPESPPPITEMWRWKNIDLKIDESIHCGCELKNENLCLASSTGLYTYNGYSLNFTPFPKPQRNMITYSIIQDQDGIYLNTSKGIFLLKKEWKQLLKTESPFKKSKQLFFKNKNGVLFTGTSQSLFSIRGDKLKKWVHFDGIIYSLLLTSKNELFVGFFDKNQIIRTPLNIQTIQDKKTWNSVSFDGDKVRDCTLLTYGSQGDVLAVNYEQHSPSLRFTHQSKTWTNIMVGGKAYNHAYLNALQISPETSIIFAKSKLHILHKEIWYEIGSNQRRIPVFAPFAFMRKNGNVIMGGKSGGLFEIDQTPERWQTYTGLNYQCDDKDGNAWFLSLRGEIIEHLTMADQWVVHKGNILNVPNSILADKKGTIWVSGSHNGVAAVSHYKNEKWHTNRHPELLSTIGYLANYELNDGRLFFGSGHEGPKHIGGGIVYESIGNDYKTTHIHPPQVPFRITSLAQTTDNKIYFGGYQLSLTEQLLTSDIKQIDMPNAAWIDAVVSSSENIVYVGVWERGLFKINPKEPEKLIHINGTENLQVSNLLNDHFRKNNLWISTSDGIRRTDGKSWIENPISNEFLLDREGGTLKQSSDGAIWVNFLARDWQFRLSPEYEMHTPTFRTTRYMPDNQPPIAEFTHIDTEITEPANILVKWKGIDRWSNTPEEELVYSLKVDTRDWSKFKPYNETTIMSLKQGSHQISLQVRDNDGNYNINPIKSEFVVLPVIWKRPWFISSVGLGILIILILITLLIRQRILSILQIEEFKLQFFTNLSHEMRTPLTVIMWPLKAALEKMPQNDEKNQVQIAYRNTKKLSVLIDQILEFRRIETGKMESHVVISDLIQDIKESMELMSPLIQEKNINLIESYSHKKYFAKYDSEKIEHILTNLVSNAVKYSHKNGVISLKISIEPIASKNGNTLKIVMEDEGIGIEQNQLKHVFKSFYRVNKGKDQARGVGLGLALVKSLVDSMEGDIIVESPASIHQGKHVGTRFTVSTPLEKADENSKTFDSAKKTTIDAGEVSLDKKILIIAEDDAEIRSFIALEFRSEFQVIECENGKKALLKSKQLIPDVIITDIMMPVMDGNTLIKNIRKDVSLRHIPIIALSAQRNEEHALRSLSKGADDYLNKPASLPILRQKVKNAIQTRELLRQNYQQEIDRLDQNSHAKTQGSADDEFLHSCKEILEQNLYNPNFEIEHLSQKVGMSRNSLHRKFKAITGHPPGNFVRELKMQTAAKLLSNANLTVSEVSDAVGFQEVANFSRAFKKRFKINPTNYRRKPTNKDRCD